MWQNRQDNNTYMNLPIVYMVYGSSDLLYKIGYYYTNKLNYKWCAHRLTNLDIKCIYVWEYNKYIGYATWDVSHILETTIILSHTNQLYQIQRISF